MIRESAVCLSLMFFGCQGTSAPSAKTTAPASDGLGLLRVLIHDGPTDDVDEVWVAFNSVRAHHVDEGWLVVSEQEQSFDLLQLQDSAALLGSATLPVGSYDELRLVLTDAWVVVNGETEPLDVPSGTTSGLKLKADFEVADCGETTLSLDWDVGAQLTHNPQGYKLRPVLDVETGFDDSSCNTCAGEVVFEDPILEGLVRARLGILSGPLTGLDMQVPAMSFLPFGDKGITSLSGLECAGETPTYLNIHNNPISDLGPVAALTNLEVLYPTLSPISDISPIVGLSQLLDFRIDRTNVTDISALAQGSFPALSTFSTTGQTLSDWSPLSNLTGLQVLTVRESNFSDLSLLSPVAPLRRLFGGSSDISDLSLLQNGASLEYIELGLTPIVDISPVAGYPLLSFLDLRSTAVSDLSPLAGHPALSFLLLDKAPITDLSPLSGLGLIQLTIINCPGLSDFSPLLDLPALISLKITDTSFDCAGPIADTLLSQGVTIVGCP